MILSSFEMEILETLSLPEKDARKMCRTLEDMEIYTGFTKREIFEFLLVGCKAELLELSVEYNWNRFKKQVQGKLVKKEIPNAD